MSKIVHNFLYFQTLIKVSHWQTSLYSSHKATDELYEKMQDLVDKFIEVYQGKYSTILFVKDNVLSIPLRNMNDNDDIRLHLNQLIQFLQVELINLLPSSDDNSDLINISQELTGCVNQALFLLTLK